MKTPRRSLKPPPIQGPCSHYIGIDPGAHGGIAVLSVSGDIRAWELRSLSKYSLEEVWKILKKYATPDLRPLRYKHDVFAVIEQVGGYIKASKDGEVGGEQPGSRQFKFGASYGALEGFLIAAGIPRAKVHPRTWQRDVGMKPRMKGESKTSWKRRIRDHAATLFPSESVVAGGARQQKDRCGRITLSVADAMLMAEYGRRWIEGEL